MSKLNIDQQTIKELFSNKRSDFIIPDYQRPYAWEETECQTLWDDIFSLRSRKMIIQNLIVIMTSIFLVLLLLLRMMQVNWR